MGAAISGAVPAVEGVVLAAAQPSPLRSLSLHLQNGNTALAIAKRLGYISVVDTLKVVTEEVTTTTTVSAGPLQHAALEPCAQCLVCRVLSSYLCMSEGDHVGPLSV